MSEIRDYAYYYRKWKYDKHLSSKERAFYYSLIHFPTFAKTYLKIKTKKKAIVNFKFNSVQKLIYPIFKKHNRAIILKYRQGGVSTLIGGIFFWDTILHPATNTIVVAHRNDAVKNNLFPMVKRYYENLPPELIEFLSIQVKYNTKEELVFKDIESIYQVGSTDSDFGRSSTINNLHLSEFAFWKQSKADNFADLSEAVPMDSGNIYIESTPNGLNTFRDKYLAAKKPGAIYKAIFLPWYKHPEYIYKPNFTESDLTPEEKILKEKYNLTLEQIAFRRYKIEDIGKDLFKQEYPEDDESCFLQSSSSIFNKQILRSIKNYIIKKDIKPKFTVTLREFFNIKSDTKLKIFKLPEKNKEYFICVDPAGGEKSSIRTDPSAVVVIEKDRPLKIVATYDDKIKPGEFSAFLVALGKLYNKALIIAERNNVGEIVLYNLQNGFILKGKSYAPYGNVFWESERKIGWRTTVGNKSTIVEFLNEGIEKGDIEIPDLDIISELETFVEKRSISGRIIQEAESGKHDDFVMALAIGYYVIRTDNRLKHNDFWYSFV